jgi:hypothetical protein
VTQEPESPLPIILPTPQTFYNFSTSTHSLTVCGNKISVLIPTPDPAPIQFDQDRLSTKSKYLLPSLLSLSGEKEREREMRSFIIPDGYGYGMGILGMYWYWYFCGWDLGLGWDLALSLPNRNYSHPFLETIHFPC